LTTVTTNGKEYKIEFTNLSVIRSKKLLGQSFYSLADLPRDEKGEPVIDAEVGLERALSLLLLGLQVHHSGEFQAIDDVAAIFPRVRDLQRATPAINAELVDYMAIDDSLRIASGNGQDSKKKPSRGSRAKTSTLPSAASSSELPRPKLADSSSTPISTSENPQPAGETSGAVD
jgi:hypothetical protein